MALTAYISATNRLLQNPVPATPIYANSDLIVWINEARQQLAGDAECVRALTSATLSTGQQLYPFSLFSVFNYPGVAAGSIFFPANPSPGDTITLNGVLWTFVASGAVGNQINIGGTTGITIAVNALPLLQASVNPSLTVAAYSAFGGPTTVTLTVTYKSPGPAGNAYTLAASAATPSGATLTGGTVTLLGIQGVLSVRQLSIASGGGYKVMVNRPWSWFNRYNIANGSALTNGVPNTWSVQTTGSVGTFGVGPPPSSGLSVQADAVCLPIPLVDDTTPEAIPYPFTDAIQYYAAYKAYLSSQRTQDATIMLNRYKEYTQRAIAESTPTVLPMNYPGGRGAQITGSKQSLTQPPPAQGGQ